jgi:hypothetical protein
MAPKAAPFTFFERHPSAMRAQTLRLCALGPLLHMSIDIFSLGCRPFLHPRTAAQTLLMAPEIAHMGLLGPSIQGTINRPSKCPADRASKYYTTGAGCTCNKCNAISLSSLNLFKLIVCAGLKHGTLIQLLTTILAYA